MKMFIKGLGIITFLWVIYYPCNADNLHTNQSYIENVNIKETLDVKKYKSVFEYVFNSLPNEVTVYPTENYYYFSFHNKGVEFSGNIRLDALDRDKGILHFAYFTTFNKWNDELISNYMKLSKINGVFVKKIQYLKYQVSYNNKTIIFNLNDLSSVKPNLNKITRNESYIGPIYDESGLQMYLVYNSKLKIFHYILKDNEYVPERFIAKREDANVLIGNRTGFAFYKDKYKKRLILIGVYEGNSIVNNYFDGPFDQLPDNFMKTTVLQEALIDQSPELQGKIDIYGNTNKGNNRILITPYMHYIHESDLEYFSNCVRKHNSDKNNYYRCFNYELDETY